MRLVVLSFKLVEHRGEDWHELTNQIMRAMKASKAVTDKGTQLLAECVSIMRKVEEIAKKNDEEQRLADLYKAARDRRRDGGSQELDAFEAKGLVLLTKHRLRRDSLTS